MNIADRIQCLRKSKGISQEQLADFIGVSRQAVSKWESEQSVPDIEKVILLSDFFDVTTDYLLKGIEPEMSKCKTDARIFALIATAVNLIGLLAAIIIWKERQTSASVFVGFIIMVIGCMVFGIGQFIGENKNKGIFIFGSMNVWILSLMPISSLFCFLQGIKWGHWWTFVPVPKMGNSIGFYVLCWLSYFLFCMIVDIMLIKRRVPK